MQISRFQIISRLFFGTLKVQRTSATVVPAVSGFYIAGETETVPIILLALTVFVLHASANTLNDIADYRADKINSPDRLLVMEILSTRQVSAISIVLMMTGLLFALRLDWLIFVVVATLGLVLWIAYNFGAKLKDNPVGSAIYLSMSTSTIPFLGGFIVMRNLNIFSIMLAVFTVIFTSPIIIDSLKDIRGDTLTKKRTVAVALGEEKARRLVLALLIIPILAYPFLWLLFGFAQVILLYAVAPASLRLLISYLLRSGHDITTPRILTRLLIVVDFTILALARPESGFPWL